MRNQTSFTSERVAEINRSRALSFEDFYIPEPMSGCWLWLGGLDGGGYGFCTEALHGDRKAHRASWIKKSGPIPSGLWVLHKCDTRSCVNPDHLFLGTHQDNIDDMWAKNRAAKKSGILNGRARLSIEQVQEIRQAKGSQVAVGKQYGICQAHVYRIRSGKSWK